MNPLQRLKIVKLITPQAVTDGNTVTANLDCRDSNQACILVNFASELNTNAVNPTLQLLHSDDTVVSNFATVTADITADLTAAREYAWFVNLKGKKRYLRLSIALGTATNDDVTVAANAFLTPAVGPTAFASIVDGSADTVTEVA